MNFKPEKSLSEMNSSVDTTLQSNFWKKLFAFIGPAYLISVGYMDPGNWATDIAGGSKYGYMLIWVLLLSNLIALLLQNLSARLGLAGGLDLAQASRQNYPPVVNFFLWILAEIAIAACDLAEVIGMAIGLNLLFGLPMMIGVSITIFDTFILLLLQRYGMRKMEAFIIALIAIIGIAFIIEMFFVHPDGKQILLHFIPSSLNKDSLYIAVGIIGATVMPHNLYLHSSLVQTRKIERNEKGIKAAIKFNIIDTSIALNLAFFVNAAILIMAAAAFYGRGLYNVSEIQDAYKLLTPLLGSKIAPLLFAIALIAAGQSSTLTGTLSGQIVMEGYLNLRIQPWLRRVITRSLAILPAFFTLWYFGDDKISALLILSQVVLSLQLGFAIVPLIHFVSDKKIMGKFTIKMYLKIMAWTCAAFILALNIQLVYETLQDWMSNPHFKTVIEFIVVPIVVISGLVLIYVTLKPFFKKSSSTKKSQLLPADIKFSESHPYKTIAITVDFSPSDSIAINNAISQGGNKAHYVLIHIVETAGAFMMYDEIADQETFSDKQFLKKYEDELENKGYQVTPVLGYGNPKISIPEIVIKQQADLLVMGAHGHRALKDIIFGTTVESVRHKVKIPVMIVQKN